MTALSSSGSSVGGEVLYKRQYAQEWMPENMGIILDTIHPIPAGRGWLVWEHSRQGATAEVLVGQPTIRNPGPSAATRPPPGSYALQWHAVSRQRTDAPTWLHSIGSPGILPVAASYRLLADHYLPGGFYAAGSIISEGDGSIPYGWIPSLAVDPQNTQAIQAFWNAGPRAQIDAETYRTEYPYGFFISASLARPSVYWQQVGTSSFYQLTGAGASLGPKDAR